MNWRARAVHERIAQSALPAPPATRPARQLTRRAPSRRPSRPTTRPRTPPVPQGRRLGRAAARLALAPTLWAAWRLARSGRWSEELQSRIGAHARYWEQLADRHGDVLYIAIGDSTAQGIGAHDPPGSYVGQLERMLDPRLRVVNLSVSGARLADVAAAILPRLETIETGDALVTFAAGANDIADFDPARFRSELTQILDALPAHALVAEIPSFYVTPYQPRVRHANAILHALADERDLAVVPLFGATRRLGIAAVAVRHAPDLFHPNDRGYRVWARAFLGPARARITEIDARRREPTSPDA